MVFLTYYTNVIQQNLLRNRLIINEKVTQDCQYKLVKIESENQQLGHLWFLSYSSKSRLECVLKHCIKFTERKTLFAHQAYSKI